MSESIWHYPVFILLFFIILGFSLVIIINEGNSISLGKSVETCITILATNETTCTTVKEGLIPP